MSADLIAQLKTLTVARPKTFTRRRYRAQVTAGPSAGASHDFDGRLRIGGRKLADFVVSDQKVSGLHCELLCEDELRVRDLGSKNGTFVGGYRVFDALLPAGESLTIGDTRIRLLPIDELVNVPLHDDDRFFGMVGRSAAIRAVTAQLARLAQTDTTVLLSGETGTGKECACEALHLGSARADGPLVVVDCGALPPNLIESELFGYERGAFTGADRARQGALERAHGGTLFLDEIGELPLELQPRLLRAIESRRVRRLGGQKDTAIDARVVAASHRDLAIEVSRGRFREDLYYRLAVVQIVLPPLRARTDDIPLLAIHLLEEMGVDPAEHLTAESLATLSSYEWPGNVRELRNTLERAVALMKPVVIERETVSIENVATINLRLPISVGKQEVVDQFERAYLTAMLAECGGNVSECARRAGMDRMSIYRITQRLGLKTGRSK